MVEIVDKSPIYGKGKVTIPKEVREYLKVNDGDSVFFLRDREGRILIKKAPVLKEREGRYELESP